MVASDPNQSAQPPQGGPVVCLPAPALQDRLEEEINRAARHGTPLSCLLVVVDNLGELSHKQGSELPEQTLTYIATALRRELRRFDRIGRPSDTELLVVLPGADGPRGEVVGRRLLDRLSTIKVEADGERRPLRVSLGLAPWHEDVSGEELMAQTRSAAKRGKDEEQPPDGAREDLLQAGSPPRPGRPDPA